jgi:competence protein ComEA
MLKWLQNYFDMSRPQAWSALALAFLCVLLFGFSYYIPYLQQPQIMPTDSILLAQLKNQLAIDSTTFNFNNKPSAYKKMENDGKNIRPFTFNPNVLEEAGWLRLGLSEKSVKTIMNYKAKGGQFYSKADVAKMYSISEAEYKVLASYIQLPEQKKYERKAYTPYTPVVININTADTAQWNKLRGIGAVLSQRIVEYRSKLGGFYSAQQIKEIGISDTLFLQIKSQLQLTPNSYKRISINTVLFQDLSQHPYFKNMALAILKLRKSNGGKLTNWEAIQGIEGLDAAALQRARPYVVFD